MITMPEPFFIKDAALIALATGERARNLRELARLLRDIDPNSLYYHFWGGLLRPRFDNPEYHNDFAIWIAHSLRDKALAERLSVIDPVTIGTIEALRERLLDLIEERLDETEFPLWARRDDQFEFIRFQVVIFETPVAVVDPADFVRVLPEVSLGSIFYHFVEARRRNQNDIDDFRNWLAAFGDGYAELGTAISSIPPYFSSLSRLRSELSSAFENYFAAERPGP
jgi:hypothetical protein